MNINKLHNLPKCIQTYLNLFILMQQALWLAVFWFAGGCALGAFSNFLELMKINTFQIPL